MSASSHRSVLFVQPAVQLHCKAQPSSAMLFRVLQSELLRFSESSTQTSTVRVCIQSCCIPQVRLRRVLQSSSQGAYLPTEENGGVHVAAINVKAPSKDFLTAYEKLLESSPNPLCLSPTYPTMWCFLERRKGCNFFRSLSLFLQEGFKCLLYMILHARVVLDLWEQPEQEKTFEQVEGDFDSFQWNRMLHQFGSQHTVLKYTVDMKIRKDCILPESMVEEVIYEDQPSNLCAIHDRVESLGTDSISSAICLLEASNEASLAESEQAASTCGCPESSELKEEGSAVECVIDSESSTHKKSPEDLGLKLVKRHTQVKELMNDFRVLEGEIRGFIAAYGTEGIMPLRRHMRRHGRIDLEKAITAMGGFRTVAMRMKLSLAYKERKPVGYWDEVQNLRNEVISVQKEIGGDPTVLPSRLSIEKIGRYSLARALEKWGGTKETAKILGLKTTRVQNKEQRSKNSSAKKDAGSVQKPVLVGMATPLDTKKEEKQPTRDSNKEPPQNALDPLSSNQVKHKKMPFKTDVPQESSKWLTLFTDAAQPGITDD